MSMKAYTIEVQKIAIVIMGHKHILEINSHFNNNNSLIIIIEVQKITFVSME